MEIETIIVQSEGQDKRWCHILNGEVVNIIIADDINIQHLSSLIADPKNECYVEQPETYHFAISPGDLYDGKSYTQSPQDEPVPPEGTFRWNGNYIYNSEMGRIVDAWKKQELPFYYATFNGLGKIEELDLLKDLAKTIGLE